MSPPPEPVRKTKLAGTDRRRQLVSIAMNHLAVKGFKGLHFQEVTEEAGINNATLYHYFPSKETLIQGVVSQLMEESKRPRARPNCAPANARDELRLELEGVRELLRAQPKLFVVLTELALRALRDPAIKKLGESRDDFWRGHLCGIIQRGSAQGACFALRSTSTLW